MVKPPARPRAWRRMLSGRRLDLIDPSPLDVEIADIAHGVARWNGQTEGPEIFSVAQHSLLVEALFRASRAKATRAEQLTALRHDAPELSTHTGAILSRCSQPDLSAEALALPIAKS